MDMSRKEVKERSKRNCQTHHTYCTCLPIYMYMLYMYNACTCVYMSLDTGCVGRVGMPTHCPSSQPCVLCVCSFVSLDGGFLGFFLLLSILLLVCYTHIFPCTDVCTTVHVHASVYTCIHVPAFTLRLFNSAELAPPFNWMLNSSTRD